MPEKAREKKSSAAAADGALTFEDALSRLEATIEALEKPDLTLDASLDLFEKGISLIRTCDSHLKKAQSRVTELLKSENGEYMEKILGSTLEAFMAKDIADE
jgi:exodeoxyribonuclease VII small subunit